MGLSCQTGTEQLRWRDAVGVLPTLCLTVWSYVPDTFVSMIIGLISSNPAAAAAAVELRYHPNFVGQSTIYTPIFGPEHSHVSISHTLRVLMRGFILLAEYSASPCKEMHVISRPDHRASALKEGFTMCWAFCNWEYFVSPPYTGNEQQRDGQHPAQQCNGGLNQCTYSAAVV